MSHIVNEFGKYLPEGQMGFHREGTDGPRRESVYSFGKAIVSFKYNFLLLL